MGHDYGICGGRVQLGEEDVEVGRKLYVAL